ncbi:SGNH/GDSL hydrolase family protein [Pelobium manganitolerans]|uniref:SGNH/GDSL hydrolase family protein n=1 Tax=Pelobium manganitolerans TaxID=1842495 RepID=UPI003FA3B3DC
MIKRRDFLKNTTLTATLALSIPQIVEAAIPEFAAPAIKLNQGDVILFQGDSITDAGRKKESKTSNQMDNLGYGYALHAAAELLVSQSAKRPEIYNKGISGNKVYQLANRWDTDCLELKPSVLSILIGVNDYWHKHNGKYDGTTAIYEKDYRALLERTKKALPNVKLVIGEPFAVKDVKAVDNSWYPEFDEYRAAAKKIANEFGAIFIPYQQVFDEAQKHAPGSYWTGDGVHPSLPGAKLMANAWLKATKLA